MPVIATWSPADAALDALVPIGLAVAAGTALVVDLDPTGPASTSAFTLADIVRRGPTRAELEPSRPGPAILPNGGITADDAAEVVGALAERWPAMVLRCPPGLPRPAGAVAFLPWLPPPFTIRADLPVVYQRCFAAPPVDVGGVVLPIPSRRVVAGLLAHRHPARADRWLRSLRSVWDLA